MKLLDREGRLFGRLNLLDGLALFLGLFGLAIVLHFARQDFLRHTTLTLERAVPGRFVPGVDTWLSIEGNAFGPDTAVLIDGNRPLVAYQVNESRIDLKPPPGLGIGWRTLSVSNSQGRTVSRGDLLEVVWKPRVTGITLEGTSSSDMVAAYRIQGDWLEDGCRVTWNGTPAQSVRFVSSSEMKIQIHLAGVDQPLTQLKLENPYGGLTLLEGEDLLMDLGHLPPSAFWKPVIDRLFPGSLYAERDSTLVIVGRNFDEGAVVRVGRMKVEEVAVLHGSILSFTLPAYSLPLGLHPVEITNVNGETALLPDGLAVREKGQVKVTLRFEGLRPKQMDWLWTGQAALKEPLRLEAIRVVRILKRRLPSRDPVDRGYRPDGLVEAEMILPVLVDAPFGSLRFSYGEVWLEPGGAVPIEAPSGPRLEGRVIGAPELLRKKGKSG